MAKSIRNTTTSGIVWSLLERFCAQGVSLAVTVVLARILEPSNYGVIAIATIFTSFLSTFVIGGFPTALVQKNGADELDFNSVFFTNIAISVVLYAVLFFSAPYIAIFYKMSELVTLIRVMALVLPVSALSAVQNAYMQKYMQFKKYFVVTLASNLFSGLIGIAAAISGAGVWALAIQTLSQQALDVVFLYIISSWKPKFQYSLSRIKELLPFGVNTLITLFIRNIESEARGLIIGKKFSKEDLAFYNNGAAYPKLVFVNIGYSITRVMLPVFSKEQNDIAAVKSILRRSVQISLYLMVPILAGLIAVAEPMVRVIYGEKWLLSVPFIQIISLSYLTQSYESSCSEAIRATGRSGIVLMNMAVTKFVSLLTIVVAVLWLNSVTAIAWTSVLWTLVSVVLNAAEVAHFFKYSVWEQLKDSLPSLILSGIMCAVVYSVKFWFRGPVILLLILQIAVGAAVYIGASRVFKLKSFYYLLDYAKDILKIHKAGEDIG